MVIYTIKETKTDDSILKIQNTNPTETGSALKQQRQVQIFNPIAKSPDLIIVPTYDTKDTKWTVNDGLNTLEQKDSVVGLQQSSKTTNKENVGLEVCKAILQSTLAARQTHYQNNKDGHELII